MISFFLYFFLHIPEYFVSFSSHPPPKENEPPVLKFESNTSCPLFLKGGLVIGCLRGFDNVRGKFGGDFGDAVPLTQRYPKHAVWKNTSHPTWHCTVHAFRTDFESPTKCRFPFWAAPRGGICIQPREGKTREGETMAAACVDMKMRFTGQENTPSSSKNNCEKPISKQNYLQHITTKWTSTPNMC